MKALITLVFLLLTISANANIGDDMSKLIERYGQPTLEQSPPKSTNPVTNSVYEKTIAFKRDDRPVSVFIKWHRCVRIVFYHLSHDEVFPILMEHDGDWEKVGKGFHSRLLLALYADDGTLYIEERLINEARRKAQDLYDSLNPKESLKVSGSTVIEQTSHDKAMEVEEVPRFTYDMAESFVRSNYKCETMQKKSSMIYKVEFYPVDGQNFMLVYFNTNKAKGYIYEGVPVAVWEGWKKAGSKGRYYNTAIKGRYRFGLNR